MIDAADANDFVRRVHRSPALMTAVRDLAPTFAKIGRRLSQEDVYVALQPCLILWGAPYDADDEASETMQRAWMKVYSDALNWLPQEALDYAISEWIKVGKPYFPKPSELTRLANMKATYIHKVCYWIRKAAESVPAPRAPEDPAKKAEIDTWIKDLRAGRVSLGGKVDARPYPVDQHAAAERIRAAAKP